MAYLHVIRGKKPSKTLSSTNVNKLIVLGCVEISAVCRRQLPNCCIDIDRFAAGHASRWAS